MPAFWSTDGARVALSAGLSPGYEGLSHSFEDYAARMYKANGIVFSCVLARMRVFAQGRPAYQKYTDGRPAQFFRLPDLELLERPWTNANTAMLLANMEIDASVAGNFFCTLADEEGRVGRAARAESGLFLSRLRPDWCTLVLGSKAVVDNWNHPSIRVLGLLYRPPSGEPFTLLRKEFIHYAPIPDPEAKFRGMSWLTPIVREALADGAYTTHKLSFLRNGAMPNMAITMGEDVDDEDFQAFVKAFRDEYEGAGNAYKTLLLAGGADVTPLSVNFQQLDLKATQGHGETRIAAAAGVHPTLAGLSEGLAGSSLNAGNFGATRRLFVDATIRHLWACAAPALETLRPPPSPQSQRLWIDDRDIPFLREDASDEAQTFAVQVTAARQAVEGGWEPDAAVEAAKARDVGLLLGKHTGLISVQLNPPGSGSTPDPVADSTQDNAVPAIMPAPSANGNGRVPAA